jgi:hypothetical protein
LHTYQKHVHIQNVNGKKKFKACQNKNTAENIYHVTECKKLGVLLANQIGLEEESILFMAAVNHNITAGQREGP